jgi:hypothetical protein
MDRLGEDRSMLFNKRVIDLMYMTENLKNKSFLSYQLRDVAGKLLGSKVDVSNICGAIKADIDIHQRISKMDRIGTVPIRNALTNKNEIKKIKEKLDNKVAEKVRRMMAKRLKETLRLYKEQNGSMKSSEININGKTMDW